MTDIRFDSFSFVPIAQPPYPSVSLSGLQTVVGGDGALFDNSDDTYVDIHTRNPTGEASGSGLFYEDGIAVTPITDIRRGDTITVRMMYPDFRGRNLRLNLSTLFSDDVAFGVGSAGIKPAGEIFTTQYVLDPALGGDVLFTAGTPLYIFADVASGEPGTPPYNDTDYFTRIYRVGPASSIPPLRLYPRHDKRLYPPTRSRGIRPVGYL